MRLHDALLRTTLVAALALGACRSTSDTGASAAPVSEHVFASGAKVKLPDGAREGRTGSGGLGDAQAIYPIEGRDGQFVHVTEMGATPSDCRLRLLRVIEAEPSPVFSDMKVERTVVAGQPALLMEAKLTKGKPAGNWLTEYFVCRNGIGVSAGMIAPALDDDVRGMARTIAESFEAPPAPEGWDPAPRHVLSNGATLSLPRGAAKREAKAVPGGGTIHSYALGGAHSGLAVGIGEPPLEGECQAALDREWATLETRAVPDPNGNMRVHAHERRTLGGAPALYWEYTQREPAQSAAMLLICTGERFAMVTLSGAEGPPGAEMRGIMRVVGDSYAPAQ